MILFSSESILKELQFFEGYKVFTFAADPDGPGGVVLILTGFLAARYRGKT